MKLFNFCFLVFFCSTNFALNMSDSTQNSLASPINKPEVKKVQAINSEALSNALKIFEPLGPDLQLLLEDDNRYVLQGSIFQISKLLFVSPKGWNLPTKYRLNKKGGQKYLNSSIVEIKKYVFRNIDDKRTKKDPSIEIWLAHKIVNSVSSYYMWTSLGLTDESHVGPLFNGTLNFSFPRKPKGKKNLKNIEPLQPNSEDNYGGDFDEIYNLLFNQDDISYGLDYSFFECGYYL